MPSLWLALAIACAGVLAYVFLGYPQLLRLIVWVRGAREIARADITPPVSLIISAYNEANVIAAKLENALALDYPATLLEIVVISDASSDETDSIAQAYARRGVGLHRQAERRGKTAGLNAVVPHLGGEIIVFSDANAMYEPDALRMLVRNFADPQVGCVTGLARYAGDAHGAAEEGEDAYWTYEIRLKQLETAVGSCVGGDGAIYAIRRPLWQTLPEDGINDFLNPLQIVAAGWRGVYEPAAVAYEEPAGETAKEYRRRVRIVSRSWRAVFQAPDVLKPWKVGIFALSVVSHKVLRWWSGVFALGTVAGVLGVLAPLASDLPAIWWIALVLLGATCLFFAPARHAIDVGGYFAAISWASMVGVYRGSLGRVSGVWSTPRESTHTARPILDRWTISSFVLGVIGLVVLGIELEAHLWAARIVFWVSLGTLAYVFAGYVLLLTAVRRIRRRPVHHSAAYEPSVCLLVAANDEEAVIGAKVRNALALEYPADRLRLVVASDGSVDGTNAIVAAIDDPRVSLVAYPERRGKISAINATMPRIDSDVVIFSDANAFLRDDAVRMLVRNFADPAVGGVSGDVVLTGERAALATSEDLYYRYERWLQRGESDLGSIVGVDGALYAIRRSLFVAPPPDTVLDDMAVPMAVIRQGYRVVFDTNAMAYEIGARSAWEEFARKTRIVAGAVQFLRRGAGQIPWRAPQVVLSLFSHKVLRWASPVIGAAFLTTCYARRGDGLAYTVIWGATLLAVSLGLLGCAPALRRLAPIGLCYYFCMVHLAAAVGLLRGILSRQSVAWERFARTSVDPVARARQAHAEPSPKVGSPS